MEVSKAGGGGDSWGREVRDPDWFSTRGQGLVDSSANPLSTHQPDGRSYVFIVFVRGQSFGVACFGSAVEPICSRY